jgi:hypothetical protein
MAVGLASGLAAIAFTALLADAVAYIYLGAQLAGIGWVYFGFGVADGRPSAIDDRAHGPSLLRWRMSSRARVTGSSVSPPASRACWRWRV